jgi:hypothetical protein
MLPSAPLVPGKKVSLQDCELGDLSPFLPSLRSSPPDQFMLRALVKGFPTLAPFRPSLSLPFNPKLRRTLHTTLPAMSSDLLSRLEALSISVPSSAVVQHGPVSGSKAWKEALEGKEGVPEKCKPYQSHIAVLLKEEERR